MSIENHSEIIKKLRSNPGPYREFQTALKIIGDKWSALILLCVLERPCRFTDIQTLIPDINPRTLTQKLRMLEDYGLITRREYKEFPPRTEYTSTQKAHELKSAIIELKKWAKKYCQ